MTAIHFSKSDNPRLKNHVFKSCLCVFSYLPSFADQNADRNQFDWNKLSTLCMGPAISYYERFKEAIWRHFVPDHKQFINVFDLLCPDIPELLSCTVISPSKVPILVSI